MEGMDAFNADVTKEKIKALEQKIRHHQHLYYNGESEISDEEFDALWDELERLCPNSDVLKNVGKDINDGFKKVRHIIPMGSQQKARNAEEFRKWASKQNTSAFVVEHKLDGASIELQYIDGVFMRAVTRGDGKIGDDITANVKKMKGVVERINVPLRRATSGSLVVDGQQHSERFSGAVRGEVVMRREVYAAVYSDKANCRNVANGIMKRKDGEGSEFLEVLCYDVGYLKNIHKKQILNDSVYYENELQKLQWLASIGFKTVDVKLCHDVNEVIEYRDEISKIRTSLPFDIDGLVVKNIEIDLEDWKRVRPEKQIAFKFETEKAISIVEDVEWSESGATYTPIAIIREVKLAGTFVKRASLANINIINSLGIRIGSKVEVAKRGEIIPKIEKVLENPPSNTPIQIPKVCTSCYASLVCDGGRLYCPNEKCPKLAFHRIKKWIDVLDIREIGPTLLDHLFTSGNVTKIKDLYLLSIDVLSSMERMGTLSSQKVYDAIHSKTSISLAQFIAGFDMENIGLMMADKIVLAGFDTVEKLFEITEEQLDSIEGFAQKMSSSFISQLHACKEEMQELLASGYISIKNDINRSLGKLAGKSFCFTGELKRMKRKVVEKLVIDAGGIVKNSVSRGLTYLVTNDSNSTSTKFRKAVELNIEIIDEEKFFTMF